MVENQSKEEFFAGFCGKMKIKLTELACVRVAVEKGKILVISSRYEYVDYFKFYYFYLDFDIPFRFVTLVFIALTVFYSFLLDHPPIFLMS